MREPLGAVIVPADLVGEWVRKGEVVPGYFNPGGIFSRIHFVLHDNDFVTNDDLSLLAEPASISITRLRHRGLGVLVDLRFGGRSGQTSKLAGKARAILNDLRFAPDVIRCYGNDTNAVLGRELARRGGTPLAISLHINPDINPIRSGGRFRTAIRNLLMRSSRQRSLQQASVVWPVYRSIEPYLEQRGIRHHQVVYNAVGQAQVTKSCWATEGMPRLLWVGNLTESKDPTTVLEVLPALPRVHFTIVGDGPLLGRVKDLVKRHALESRVTLVERMTNEELLASLHTYDLGVVNTLHAELSKVMIEFMLAKLPFVINAEGRSRCPELNQLGDDVLTFEPETLFQTLGRVLEDEQLRANSAEQLFQIASTLWSPEACLDRQEEAYLRLVADCQT